MFEETICERHHDGDASLPGAGADESFDTTVGDNCLSSAWGHPDSQPLGSPSVTLRYGLHILQLVKYVARSVAQHVYFSLVSNKLKSFLLH